MRRLALPALLTLGCAARPVAAWEQFGEGGESEEAEGEAGSDSESESESSSSESSESESSSSESTESTDSTATATTSPESESGPGCEAFVLVENWNGWTYFQVLVPGVMTDTNIEAACAECGLAVPCSGPIGCEFNDDLCVQTQNETSCGNPMLDLAMLLCGVSPNDCGAVWGIYQYMGHNWQEDAACGAESGSWCSTGTDFSDRWTLCVQG